MTKITCDLCHEDATGDSRVATDGKHSHIRFYHKNIETCYKNIEARAEYERTASAYLHRVAEIQRHIGDTYIQHLTERTRKELGIHD